MEFRSARAARRNLEGGSGRMTCAVEMGMGVYIAILTYARLRAVASRPHGDQLPPNIQLTHLLRTENFERMMSRKVIDGLRLVDA